jgi:hypothetical protein
LARAAILATHGTPLEVAMALPERRHTPRLLGLAKHTRLYGSWFYLDGLAPGAHALRVEPVANNHAPYHHGGEPVSATAAVEAG